MPPKPERFEEYSRRQSARSFARDAAGEPAQKTIRPEGGGRRRVVRMLAKAGVSGDACNL
jgi:hypothetical protein